MKHQVSDNSLASENELKEATLKLRASQPKARPWYMPPVWVTKNLTTQRSLKIFFRCSVAVWASYIVIMPNASGKALGTVGFFVLLTSFFIPPYLPAQLFFFIMTTVMLGTLFGWGFGMAAMRSANAVRTDATKAAGLAYVKKLMESSPIYAADPKLAEETAIFRGEFLDIRSSAVYGCFLGMAAFILAFIRAYAPTLAFMSVFGTIAFDIFAVIGPLFPIWQASILTSMASSVAVYFGIGLASTILIFPETMNHAILNDVSEQLDRVKSLVVLQNDVLSMRGEGLQEEMAAHIERVKEARKVLVEHQTQLTATSRFIHLEFSWGKWNAGDVLDLLEPLLTVITRVASLQNFGQTLCMTQQTFERQIASHRMPDTSDTYLLRQVLEMHPTIEREHKVHVADILPILEESTIELRAACLAGLDAIIRSIDHINKKRWGRNVDLDGSVRDSFDAATLRLEAAIVQFRLEHRLELLRPFVPIVENHELRNALPLRTLFVSYVFGASMVGVGNAMLKLMHVIGETSEKRKRNRLWAPTGFRKLWKIVTAKGDKNNGAMGENVSSSPINTKSAIPEEVEVDYRRNPDSKPAQNIHQKFMNLLSNTWRWFCTPEGVFCVKYVIVSIVLWIPSVCKSSAKFYYDEKGIWALIMSQTMVNMYNADHIFNYVTRMVGSVIGLVIGLLVWYCGTGKGDPGSAYGIAASAAVFTPIIVFLRVYAPVKYIQGMVLAGATFALVVGYSWIDGHIPQVVTPGLGWGVAWRRAMTVFIGCAAASGVMFLPPQSGRRAVRLRNANSLGGISRLYGSLMSVWVSDKRDVGAKEAWMAGFRKRAMAASMEMATIAELTDLAKWEGRVRGRWARSDYLRLMDLQVDMISSLIQLGGALLHLDDEWRVAFLARTGVLNPNFIADVMSVFHMVAQSLRTAEPLHQVLPNSLLERLFYHQQHALGQTTETLTIEHLKSEDYMYYASGVVAVYQLLQAIDEVQKITKGLCGEEPLQGFNQWKVDFESSRASF